MVFSDILDAVIMGQIPILLLIIKHQPSSLHISHFMDDVSWTAYLWESDIIMYIHYNFYGREIWSLNSIQQNMIWRILKMKSSANYSTLRDVQHRVQD